MTNLMSNYTKGNEFLENIVIKHDSPFLIKMLERIYDKWNTTDKIHNRWKIMNEWVQLYKNGASFDEMISSPISVSYGKWWSDTFDKNNDEIKERIIEIVNMIISIDKEGYDEDKWSKIDGWSPIKVTIGGLGELWTFDGAHRTMILASLGMDIPAKIEFIRNNFLQSISVLSMLYQPSCHPCVQHIHVVRKDLERYKVIAKILKDMNIKSICEIGSAEGEGLYVLSQSGKNIVGIENENARFALSFALATETGKFRVIKEYDKKTYDAYVGLSVWHHLSKDLKCLNEWIDLTKHAKYQFIENPEPKSLTFSQQLIDDTKWNWENVGEEITQHIIKRGGYKKSEIVFTDKLYANRNTILLSK